jgi:3-oxoacyl-[acyl-carrier-protein] synthase-3
LPYDIKKIQRRVGPAQLYRLSNNETIEDLATAAALDAIKYSKINPSDLSGIYASVGGPNTEHLMPGLARIVGQKLGISDIPMISLGMGCAGGMQALETAYNKLKTQQISKGKEKNYLVIAGDHVSRCLDKQSWETAPLFSDGIAAMVISNIQKEIPYKISKIENISIDGEGDLFDMQVKNPSLNSGKSIFEMNGEGVYAFAAKNAFPIILRLLELNQLPKNGYFVPHQASKKVLEFIRDINGIPENKIFMAGINEVGNLSSASVFHGLEETLKRGLAENKDIFLGAFGAEHAVGAAHLKKV